MLGKEILDELLDQGILLPESSADIIAGSMTLFAKADGRTVLQLHDADIDWRTILHLYALDRHWIALKLWRSKADNYALLGYVDDPRIMRKKMLYIEGFYLQPSSSKQVLSSRDLNVLFRARALESHEDVESKIERFLEECDNVDVLEYELRKTAICKKLLKKFFSC